MKNHNFWAGPHITDRLSAPGSVCIFFINNEDTIMRERTSIYINFSSAHVSLIIEGHLPSKPIFYFASIFSYFKGLSARGCLKLKESKKAFWFFQLPERAGEPWNTDCGKGKSWLLGHRRFPRCFDGQVLSGDQVLLTKGCQPACLQSTAPYTPEEKAWC